MVDRPIAPPGQEEPPGGWERVGDSGRFFQIALPMSDEAKRLNGEVLRYVFYAEFDTDRESGVWVEFLKDPLRMLIAEQVTIPDHGGDLGMTIVKLVDDGKDPSTEYTDAVEARRDATVAVLAEFGELDQGERDRHVATTVVNHETALNPRIGMVS